MGDVDNLKLRLLVHLRHAAEEISGWNGWGGYGMGDAEITSRKVLILEEMVDALVKELSK